MILFRFNIHSTLTQIFFCFLLSASRHTKTTLFSFSPEKVRAVSSVIRKLLGVFNLPKEDSSAHGIKRPKQKKAGIRNGGLEGRLLSRSRAIPHKKAIHQNYFPEIGRSSCEFASLGKAVPVFLFWQGEKMQADKAAGAPQHTVKATKRGPQRKIETLAKIDQNSSCRRKRREGEKWLQFCSDSKEPKTLI